MKDISIWMREYRKTYKGRRAHRTEHWRSRGLSDFGIHENINELYDYYLSVKVCDSCKRSLTMGPKTIDQKCMDHCHITGKFRNVLCNSCNASLPKQSKWNKAAVKIATN